MNDDKQKLIYFDQMDPEYAAFLSVLPEFVFNEESLSATRELTPEAGPAPDDVERVDYTIEDGPVVVSTHRPRGVAKPLPAIVWMHGGGLIFGNRHLDNEQLERWCRSFNMSCLSVEYRLAPEHPFPVPLEDCYAALSWAATNADELGVAPDQIGVGGKSAGGGLAAALTLLARQRGGPSIKYQVLDCPMLDDRQCTPSSQLDGMPIWSRESNAFGWRSYLGDAYGTDQVSPLAAPAREPDLRGLPPAFLAVGVLDGLRDETVDYATRLNQANVPAELHVYPGVPHGTAMFPGLKANEPIIRNIDGFMAGVLAEETQKIQEAG
jgi:acetyl esterase/lipase